MCKNIIFWLEYPLFHIAPLIKSLSLRKDVNVIVITELDIPQWRLNMGFYKPDFGLAKEYFCPNKNNRIKLVNKFSTNDDYHIFHGLRHVKDNYTCFKKLIHKDAFVGLYFEPQQIVGSLKNRFRKIYYRLLLLRYGRKIDFMLALGDRGAKQYVDLGFPAKKTFSFEYHFDSCLENIPCKSSSTKLIFLYAGQLIEIKNIALVINAINLIVKQGLLDFEFLIVGDGEKKDELKKLVLDYDLEKIIRFSNGVPSKELKNHYLNSDAFILASNFEGWGAVATEAMAFGLPLIISDGCASSCIVKEDYHGFIFESDSVESLKSKLILFINDSKRLVNESNRNERIKYAKKYFSGEAGSKNLIRILNQIN